jgi:AcrR family transcriptional regulator
MAVPPSASGTDWATLSADEKRRRTLETADALFASEGLEVTMPALAHAIGIGVGSLYRQFATKDELVTELMLERMGPYHELWARTAAADVVWPAIRRTVFEVLDRAADDKLMREMLESKLDDEMFNTARTRILLLVEKATQRAIDEGALREDASLDDVRLIVRAAHEVSPGDRDSARRIAELGLDGLER